MPRKITRRKPGAHAGNKNALKRGLYAKHYSSQSRLDRQHMPPLESLPEIQMLRLQLDEPLTLMKSCEDEDARIKLYNVASPADKATPLLCARTPRLVGKD